MLCCMHIFIVICQYKNTMPRSNIAHLSHIDQHSNYFGIIIVSTLPMFKAFVGHPFLINLHPHTYFNL